MQGQYKREKSHTSPQSYAHRPTNEQQSCKVSWTERYRCNLAAVVSTLNVSSMKRWQSSHPYFRLHVTTNDSLDFSFSLIKLFAQFAVIRPLTPRKIMQSIRHFLCSGCSPNSRSTVQSSDPYCQLHVTIDNATLSSSSGFFKADPYVEITVDGQVCKWGWSGIVRVRVEDG